VGDSGDPAGGLGRAAEESVHGDASGNMRDQGCEAEGEHFEPLREGGLLGLVGEDDPGRGGVNGVGEGEDK
jgi:hypothetical protein